MSGYHTERYETECSKCDRTIRTQAPVGRKGVDARCQECGHINWTNKEVAKEPEEKGRFTGVFS